ncbi:MAG: hypothetical protein ACNA7W_08495 [Pseudomonadales bacterium]
MLENALQSCQAGAHLERGVHLVHLDVHLLDASVQPDVKIQQLRHPHPNRKLRIQRFDGQLHTAHFELRNVEHHIGLRGKVEPRSSARTLGCIVASGAVAELRLACIVRLSRLLFGGTRRFIDVQTFEQTL